MRVSDKKINKSLKNEIQRTLAQLVSDITTPSEAYIFLDSLFTESEFETYAKRVAVGYWLKKGRTYSNIKENLKVSSATIASIQEMMKKPGFEMAIKKIEAEEWANKWSEKIKKFVGN